MAERYPFICPDIGSAEIQALTEFLSSRERLPDIAFFTRPEGVVHTFNREFSQFLLQVPHPDDPLLQRAAGLLRTTEFKLFATGTANATGALIALMRALGVEGGEVITTSLNFVGVINAIVQAGATPRFVDIDPATWCMDPASAKKALSSRTRAILLTHVNRFADLMPFVELYERKGLELPLIQDASLAIGSTLRGMRPGLINLGRGGATVFSLAPSKTITGLGGAVVVGPDQEVLDRVYKFAYQGVSLTEVDRIDLVGMNLKMNDMTAVIALQQLRRREELFAKRRALKSRYDALLAPAVQAGRLQLQDVGEETVVTHYAVAFDRRTEIAHRLYEERSMMLGMWHLNHRQPVYDRSRVKLPVTESLEDRFTLLPFHTRITDEDAAEICGALLAELGVKA